MDESLITNPSELERSVMGTPVARCDGGAAPYVEGYQVLAPLGEGAMGMVWRATQLSTRREVALKLVSLAHFGSERARQRFQREVELAARLQHPNIAAIYDSGLHVGVSFYAMELIDGLPLDRHVAEHHLSRRQILQLMEVICRAVAHAHQRGVIHRDLKPTNLLVDQKGEPHVVDFGLATATIANGDPVVSIDQGILGTPAYMSPEQAAGKTDLIDTRSDVYSLGVILYRLLTGKNPHDLSGSAAQLILRVSEQEVIRPRLADPSIDSELDALLLKALAKEPDRRYPSADAFARDIGNYLNGELLTARPPTIVYFLSRRLRRHWIGVLAACVVVLAFVVLAVTSYEKVEHSRDDAVADRRIAEQNAQAAAAAERQAKYNFAESLIGQGDAKGATGAWADARRLYEQAKATFTGIGVTRPEVDMAMAQAGLRAPPPLMQLGSAPQKLTAASFAPDSKTLATATGNGTIHIWNVVTGHTLAKIEAHCGKIHSLCFWLKGDRLAVAGEDKRIRLWDWRSGSLIKTIDCPSQLRDIAISPDGQWLASGSMDGLPKLWNLTQGIEKKVTGWHARPVDRVAFSSDSSHLAYADWMGHVREWEMATETEQELGPYLNQAIGAIAFSPDGTRVGASVSDGRMAVYSSTGQFRQFFGPPTQMETLAFAVDNSIITSSSYDGSVRRWNPPDSRDPLLLCPNTFRGVAAVSPDGLIAAGEDLDGFVSVWDLQRDAESTTLTGHPGGITAIALSADKRMIASGGRDNTLRLWDVATGQELWCIQTHDMARSIAFSRDSSHLLTGGTNNAARLWNLETGKFEKTLSTGTEEVSGVAFSPDETRALVETDHWMRLWDLKHDRVIQSWHPDATLAGGVVFSADGMRGLFSSIHGCAEIGDVTNGTELLLPGAQISDQRNLNSPIASWGDLSEVIAGSDNDIVAWSSQSGTECHRYLGHRGVVRDVSISADGAWIVSCGDDQTVRLWNRKEGKEVRSFKLHRDKVDHVVIAADGGAIVSGSVDTAIRYIDLGRAAQYRELTELTQRAQQTLVLHEDDPQALATLGEWYTFRGRWDWAAELLEKARLKGERIDSIELARCYWKLGRLDESAREFGDALQQVKGEAQRSYLQLCLDAVRPRSTATTPAKNYSSRGEH